MPTISGLDTIKSVISALDKYGMLVKFQDTVKYALFAAAPNDPHAVYFVACRYNLLATANAAARLSLRKPRSLISITDEDLVHMNAMQYLLLVRFCAETTHAATTIVGTLHWLQNLIPTSRSIFSFGARIPSSCTCALKTVSWVGHKEKYRMEVFNWVWEYVDSCRVVLEETPHWEGIRDETLILPSLKLAGKCSHCRVLAVDVLPKIRDEPAARVEIAVSKIDPPFPSAK